MATFYSDSVKKGLYSTQNIQGTAGQYALIATTTITAQYVQSLSLISFFGGGNGLNPSYDSTEQRGLLYFRVKQQQPLGSAPYIDMVLMDSSNCSTSDIVAVTTVNSATQTVVKLYIKVNLTWDNIWFSPIHEPQTNVIPIMWHNQAPLVADLASLPAGVQNTAIYHSYGVSKKSDMIIPSTALVPVTSATVGSQCNFNINVYYRIVSAPTDLLVTVTYTDGSGAQTMTVVSGTAQPVGSYSAVPVTINAIGGSTISVSAIASVANRVYISCSIVPV